MSTTDAWHQIAWRDPDLLRGLSVHCHLRFLLRAWPAPWVAVQDEARTAIARGVECDEDPLVLTSSDALLRVALQNQFIWGHLFFCSDESAARSIGRTESMPNSIRKTVFTLSLVDNTFFYLYVRELDRWCDLRLVEENAEISSGELEQFVFPY